MDKTKHISKLHNILVTARHPVARKILEEQLDCSEDAINRIINESRDYLGAPIEYDSQRQGYYYDTKTDQQYELPGIWFNASELHALLAAHQLLSNVQPGFLEPRIAPLKKRIQSILNKEDLDNTIFDRIRILQMGSRRYEQKQFAMVATALLGRKQLHIHYQGRVRDAQTERTVSPQRLIYYRDNWYLDAWCHQREALRSFSLDRIQKTKLVDQTAKNIDNDALNQHYTDAYGIFSGKAAHTAILRFTPESARWVSNERWHSRQHGQFELDGSYTLEIPFSNPQELIMDILKHGPNVEVLEPQDLRQQVIDRLQQAYQQYHKECAIPS